MTESLQLRISELAAGGDGVGRDANGRVTFVPRACPGDLLEIHIREARRDFARGEIVRVLEKGPDRIEPECSYFSAGSCGGCQWQQVSSTGQRQAKSEIVARALRRFVDDGLEIHPLLTPVGDFYWRRRARLHWFRASGAARAEIGFFAPRSQFVGDIDRCVQLSPMLSAALSALRKHLAGSLYGRGRIQLLEGEDGAHIVLVGAARPGAAERLAEDPAVSGVRLGQRCYGAQTIAVDGTDVAADEFAQASESGNRALVACVDEATAAWRDGARVLELYAGGGNLTRALAGSMVVAIDRRPRRAPEGVDMRAGDATEVVAGLIASGESFDGVVLDPPRQGAKEVAPRLLELGAQHVVYISCNPATLARDAGLIVDSGFEAKSATPLDLMPQTHHVEVVMSFIRSTT